MAELTEQQKIDTWLSTYSLAMQTTTGKPKKEQQKIKEARAMMKAMKEQEGVGENQGMLRHLTGQKAGSYDKKQDAWVTARGKITYQGPRGPQPVSGRGGTGGADAVAASVGADLAASPETAAPARDLFTIEEASANRTKANKTDKRKSGKSGTRKTAGGRRKTTSGAGLAPLPGKFGSEKFADAGLVRLEEARGVHAAQAKRERARKIAAIGTAASEGTAEFNRTVNPLTTAARLAEDIFTYEKKPSFRAQREVKAAGAAKASKTRSKTSQRQADLKALGVKPRKAPTVTYKKKRPKNKNAGGGR